MAKTTVEDFVSTPDGMRDFQQERAIESVTGLICKLMQQKGVTRSQLADKLGKTRGWVTQLLDGEKNKTVRTLSDVFWALDAALLFSAGPLAVGADTKVEAETQGKTVLMNIPVCSEYCLAGAQFDFTQTFASVSRLRA